MKSSTSSTQSLAIASAVVRDLFGTPVSELYASYLDFLERAKKPSASGARYVWHVLQPHLGHRGIGEVDANVCLDYAQARRADGVKDSTIWAELSRLRAALGFAQRSGKIAIVPRFRFLSRHFCPRKKASDIKYTDNVDNPEMALSGMGGA